MKQGQFHKFAKRISFLVLIAGFLVTTLAITPPAQAAKKAVCKVSTNDIGTIIGRGPSSDEAFEDAATQCFDRREKLYRLKKGADLDEETGLAMIDNCANIRCGV